MFKEGCQIKVLLEPCKKVIVLCKLMLFTFLNPVFLMKQLFHLLCLITSF